MMSNNNIYMIIGMPRSNEPEPEVNNLLSLDVSKQSHEDLADQCLNQQTLIFTKRCLYPMETELQYESGSQTLSNRPGCSTKKSQELNSSHMSNQFTSLMQLAMRHTNFLGYFMTAPALLKNNSEIKSEEDLIQNKDICKIIKVEIKRIKI